MPPPGPGGSGGNGGSGGLGQSATGSAASRQDSEADVRATLTLDPDAPAGTPTTTTARITADILWGDIWVGQRLNWQRTINVTITIGSTAPPPPGSPPPPVTTLTFSKMADGKLRAQGTRRDGTTFTKISVDSMDASIGGLGVGLGEFTDTVNVGDRVTLLGAPLGTFSNVYSDTQTRNGGMGAGGGVGASLVTVHSSRHCAGRSFGLS